MLCNTSESKFFYNAADPKMLGVGNPFLDRIGHVDAVPSGLKKGGTAIVFEKKIADQFWEKAFGNSKYNWTLGGSCVNVVKVLSRLIQGLKLNVSCSLLGMSGKDRKQEIEKKFENLGINSLLQESNNDNGFVNCFVTPDSQRTMQTFLGASAELKKKHILKEHFKNVSYVHLEGYLAYYDGVLEKSIKLAKANGAKVSLDLSSVGVITECKDTIKKSSEEVDIIFGNFLEMQEFTGCQDISEIMNKFQARQIVIVTNGAHGGWYKLENEYVARKFEAINIGKEEVIDTTGAGDFFIGGFGLGLLCNKDIATCIKIAATAANFVIRNDGTDLPEEKWNELIQRVKALKV